MTCSSAAPSPPTTTTSGIFGGGFASVSVLGYTYISDITSQEDRTARISFLDATLILARPVGNTLGAKLYLFSGYYAVFATSGLFALLGALYAFFVLKDSVTKEVVDHKKAKKQGLCEMLKEKNPLTIVRTLFKPRKGLRRKMILWSFFLFFLHNLTDQSTIYLYTRKKFGWNEQDFSTYFSVDTVHGAVRALLVTPLLSKVCFSCTIVPLLLLQVLLVHDPMIGMLGAMSWVTCFAVWGLATKGWMMFVLLPTYNILLSYYLTTLPPYYPCTLLPYSPATLPPSYPYTLIPIVRLPYYPNHPNTTLLVSLALYSSTLLP